MLSRHGVATALKLGAATVVDIRFCRKAIKDHTVCRLFKPSQIPKIVFDSIVFRRPQERELYGGIQGAAYYGAAEDWPFLMTENSPISPKSPVVFQ